MIFYKRPELILETLREKTFGKGRHFFLIELLAIKIIFFPKPRTQTFLVLFFNDNRIRISFKPGPEIEKETQESIKYLDQLMS